MKINNTTIEFKTVNNVPVLTFIDIDKVYRWTAGTANRLFNKVKNVLTANKDYFYISKAELIAQNPELKAFKEQRQHIKLYVVTADTIRLMVDMLDGKDYKKSLTIFEKMLDKFDLHKKELSEVSENYKNDFSENYKGITDPETIKREVRGCTPINEELSIYAYNFDGELINKGHKNDAYNLVGYPKTGNCYLLININHKSFTYFKNLCVEYLQANTKGKTKLQATMSIKDINNLNQVAEYLEIKFKNKFNNLLIELDASISSITTPVFKEYVRQHLVA